MNDDLSPYLAPVSDGDPCGPDLRWDPEVTGLDTVVAQVFSADEQGVVEGKVSLPAGLPAPRELAASTRSVLAPYEEHTGARCARPGAVDGAGSVRSRAGAGSAGRGGRALARTGHRSTSPGRRGRRSERAVCRARARSLRSPPLRVPDRLGQNGGRCCDALDGRAPACALRRLGGPPGSRDGGRRADSGRCVAVAPRARGHGGSALRRRRPARGGGRRPRGWLATAPPRLQPGPTIRGRSSMRRCSPWSVPTATRRRCSCSGSSRPGRTRT